jgi:hypothetical protein
LSEAALEVLAPVAFAGAAGAGEDGLACGALLGAELSCAKAGAEKLAANTIAAIAPGVAVLFFNVNPFLSA